MPKSTAHLTEVRVGLFVFVLLIIAAAIIFAIGSERRLFQTRATLYTRFNDVAGLAEGAVVRVGGINVGAVSRIQFSTNPAQPDIVVEFRVAQSALARIRSDSVARIESMGLLGDMLLSVTIGGPGTSPVKEGTFLRSVPSPDFAAVEEDAAMGVREFAQTAQAVNEAVHALLTPQTLASVAQLTRTVGTAAARAEQGPGLLHSLLYAPAAAQNVEGLVAHADQAAVAVTRTADALHRYVLAATQQPGARQLLGNLSRAAEAADRAAAAIGGAADSLRGQLGLTQKMLTGAQEGSLLAELTRSAHDVRQVADAVARGQGTVGALLVDPTLYLEMKSFVVQLHRNAVTRAVVHYVLKRE